MAFSSDRPLQSNQVSISLEVPKPDDPAFVETMSLYLKRMADSMNTKEGALYTLKEVATFQQYFTAGDPLKTRNVYRKVVNFGALPNTAAATVAHDIAFNADFSLTRMYGAATDPAAFQYLPLPYASPTAANCIELSADATNVIITTGSDRTAFTRCTVVLEYTKNN